ncbi:kelch-like protein 10 isoform X2 [Agrilus planipennis]|uniref:Kelch-like protein diablo n=1 Tax=Agrilus planipennis TaxID=224129 RepID=A0A1W4X0Q7_AGRPL|nr:kelch-like protein 10 isoform X2 [Agrilus planipennis]
MEFTMKLRSAPSRTRITHSATNIAKLSKFAKKRHPSKCRKCVCVPQNIGSIEFPPVWMELRLNSQLCDGIVHCEDGTIFNIHRAILASVSPYFKALFTNSINRGQPETKEAHVSIPHDIFQKLLDFAYTGHCIVNNDNVEYLLRFADQYEILGVVRLCCQFVLDQLQPTNCLGILRFAKHYFCKELEERGRLYVRHHFMDLLKESVELATLQLDELLEILSDDELNIKTEESVFQAIKKWIDVDVDNRKTHLPKLLSCVRVGTLPYENVIDMLKWPPIMENAECQEQLFPIVHLLENPTNDLLDINSNHLYRPRIPYDILFAVGGWSAGSPTNFIETYDARADRWLLVMDTDNSPRAYHGLCALNGLIYMIGGFDGTDHFNTVRCFDPVKRVWKECACMYFPRCYVSVVMYEGKIYALGGYNGRVRMNSAERYDPEINQWELIQPMQKQRSDASAAALNKKIYIVGGFNGSEVMNSAECYDTLVNQWSYIPQMTTARSGVSLVAFRNSLYAFGGFDGFTRLTSAEKYTPGESIDWSEIAEMFCPRSNFATAVLDDFIYVIGGFNGSTTINYVECYDVDNNEWFDVARMNLNRSALSACVVSGLPNAKEYSLVGKCQKEMGQGAGGSVEQSEFLD